MIVGSARYFGHSCQFCGQSVCNECQRLHLRQYCTEAPPRSTNSEVNRASDDADKGKGSGKDSQQEYVFPNPQASDSNEEVFVKR